MEFMRASKMRRREEWRWRRRKELEERRVENILSKTESSKRLNKRVEVD